MKTEKMKIRKGNISVPWFDVDMVALFSRALDYARRKNTPVFIWSNDYKFKCTRYAHLQNVVLPDGRSDSPLIMQAGGVWCQCAYPDHEAMRPIGRMAAKAAYDAAGESFRDIYSGWANQPETETSK